MERPHITQEERLAFYQMIIRRVYPESGLRILIDTGPLIEYLYDHPDMKQRFMQCTYITGQTNRLYSRIDRMIQAYLLSVSSSQMHTLEDTESPQ